MGAHKPAPGRDLESGDIVACVFASQELAKDLRIEEDKLEKEDLRASRGPMRYEGPR
jgi:hypothetical protein